MFEKECFHVNIFETYSSLIEPQKCQLLPVRREPERVPVSENLFFINPIRNCIEEIWATVLCDLSRSSVLPDIQIVSLHIGHCITDGRPSSILKLYEGNKMSTQIAKLLRLYLPPA